MSFNVVYSLGITLLEPDVVKTAWGYQAYAVWFAVKHISL